VRVGAPDRALTPRIALR